MQKFILFSFINILTLVAVLAQTTGYKVYALQFAQSGLPSTAADFSLNAPKSDRVKMNFVVWLVRGNGKNILVDAGFLNDLEDAKELGVIDYIRPDSVLLRFGVKPEDITDIIFSHPHWDHIDGVTLFPNAQIWMQKEDFNYFVSTAWQKGQNNGGFEKRDVRALVELNLAGKVTLVDGDNKQIMPGINVFTGSRHTFNSQYVLVDAVPNKIILASDNIWIYYSLEHLVPPSLGGTLDPAGYVKAMQRMKTLVNDVKYIIPGHDGAVFSRFPMVAKDAVEIK
jgi:glyoxylase-like metal-dependent hydrolase (beta-lactamase superfamily II)